MKKPLPLLVVDDRWLMRQALISALQDMGLEHIIQAANGIEALRILQTTPVMAVISDYDMPSMDGMGLLRWVRNRPDCASLPFMMVSAEASPEHIDTALKAGVSEYLVKPFTTQDLSHKVIRLLGEDHAHLRLPTSEKVLGLSYAGDVEEQLPGCKILIVDDAPATIENIRGILNDEYTLDTASSGTQALQKAHAQRPPDLILLDVRMPDMDGYAVCTTLKADSATRDIPVIFLIDNDRVEDAIKAIETGGSDYINKPAEPTILKARICTHLRLKLAFAEIARQNSILVTCAKQRKDVEHPTQ